MSAVLSLQKLRAKETPAERMALSISSCDTMSCDVRQS
jgi:hypothetical protein